MKTTLTYYYLGSWTTITDAEGNLEQEASFDAWGNIRSASDWTNPMSEKLLFDRGYTGHEHLYFYGRCYHPNAPYTDFGLINMNGRMYDPVMSSFLSVDRYVQNPSNSQNFNRYAYCLNNPLKYTDPSGWQMNKPYMASYPTWGDGMNQLLEPRDAKDGSPFMVNYYLSGGGNVSYGGGGGGSSTVSFGFAVNNPQYTVEQQCALIRKWQKDPSWLNRWMMQKAGLSDINRGEVYVNGIRNTYLSWEYNGVSHTASVENEYVGGRGLWGQTVSDMGGRGSYMPPGYKGVMPDGTTTLNRTYETNGFDLTTLRGIGDGIRAVVTTAFGKSGVQTLTKGFEIAGTGLAHASYVVDFISFGKSLYNYAVNSTCENEAKLIVSGVGTGVNVLDYWVLGLGTICSMAVFAIDAAGGFDDFYQNYGKGRK